MVLPLKEPVPLTGGSDAGHPPSSEKEVGDSLLKDHVDFCIPTSSKDFSEGSDFGATKEFSEGSDCGATRSSRRPIILELCAGSARLSAACASDGFTSISVDYEGNRHKSWHHVLELDLRLPSSWDTLRKIVVMHDVVFVHIAPPCGTSSRARERPMSAGEWGPPPLRSSSHPWGLPFLSPKDRHRVEQANILYRHIAEFCRFLSNRNIKWSIENPRRSYLWELGPFIELLDVATFYDFDACMLGGTRDKRTSFLSSLDMSDICLDCDGGHDHAAWGIQEDGTFATAQEAEYPSLLCQTISKIVSRYAVSLGYSMGGVFDCLQGKPKTDTTVQVQSRKAMPPIMSEFARVVEVDGTNAIFEFDNKDCLLNGSTGVKAGAKKLRVQRKQVGRSYKLFYLFGEYRSEQQFVDEALKLQHPFDQFCDVPDCAIRLLFSMLIGGPVALTKHRLEKVKLWRQWSLQLRHREKELHDSMDPQVAQVLEPKNLLLMEKIAESFDWPDKNLFKEISDGFSLVGTPEQTGVFPPEVNVPAMSVEQLDDRAAVLKEVLWNKVLEGPFDQETWNATLEEAEVKAWIDGPFSWDDLEAKFDGNWTPARRFGITQSGKLRVIDDFSENGTNSAYACQEKLDLRTLDHLTWYAIQISNCIWKTGLVDFSLSTGEKLRGRVHPGWTEKDVGGLVTKTVDLKSAYKQFAISPEDRKRAVITVKSSEGGQPKGFVSAVLPFGAAAAVMAFNRVSRLLWRIFIEAGVLCGSYFDDFPILDLGCTSGSASSTVRAICKLLGFKCSEDKELEFADKTAMLGVIFDTSMAKEAKCVISNKPDRVKQLSESIDTVLDKGCIASGEVPKLFGRLQFAEYQVAGRVGKLALAELRELSRRSASHVVVDDQMARAFEMLRFRLCEHPPRVVTASGKERPVVVFTDGACENEDDDNYVASVGGVLYPSCGSKPLFFGGRVPDDLVKQWRSNKKHVIGLVELYAVILARHTWAKFLNGRKIIYFIDNIPAMRSLIRGTSSDSSWRSVLLEYERCESVAQSFPWMARVASKSNIADWPSRNEEHRLIGMCRSNVKCIFTGEDITWDRK